jgi:hypothetical protein
MSTANTPAFNSDEISDSLSKALDYLQVAAIALREFGGGNPDTLAIHRVVWDARELVDKAHIASLV